MKTVKVDSSNLNLVSYDELNETLLVEFHNGSMYEYYSVPEKVFNELIKAPSIGRYFQAHIRSIYKNKKIK